MSQYFRFNARSFFSKALFHLRCLLLVLLMAIMLPHTAAADELLRLAVVGVSNQSGEKELDKLLISQGVGLLVAQELYDTGRYVPVERNSEITSQVEALRVRLAAGETAGAIIDQRQSQKLDCDAVAAVTFKTFKKSRSRSSFGPFSSSKVKIALEVEVSLREGEDRLISVSGSGSGVTKARGVLFQIREDKVHFDRTSVGLATQTAVQQAVAKLMSQLEEGT